MKVVFSNPNIPSNGMASIPLPIPKTEYDQCILTLGAIGVGDVLAADCMVEEIGNEFPILQRLVNSTVNVDELDYLTKRLESFDARELGQFQCIASSRGIHNVRDFINLTFCCQNTTVVQDFSNLKQIGGFCYMDRNGGTMSQDDMQRVDFENVAIDLLQNENGKVTPYGVIYDKDFQMEQIYNGKNFPQYQFEDCIMDVEVTTTEDMDNDISPACFYLPMSDLQLERAMQRNHFTDCENIKLRFMESNLPEEADALLDFTEESILDLNELCHAVADFCENDMEKYRAAVLFTEPTTATELTNLAQQLDLFDFVPDVHTPAEYGKHMIIESGRFEYDENLADYYDFEKYGSERMAQEHGQFSNSGYISYHGFVSIAEALGGADCQRMDTTMQMGCM